MQTDLYSIQWVFTGRRNALAGFLSGLILTSVYPLLHIRTGIYPGGEVSDVGLFLTMIGTCILVWGVFFLRSGEIRPLTPLKTLLMPILLLTVVVLTDLLTQQALLEWWGQKHPVWSLPKAHTLARRFPEIYSVAGSSFAIVGSAVKQNRYRALVGGVLLIGIVSWIGQLPTYATGVHFIVLVLGIIPAVLGFTLSEKSPD